MRPKRWREAARRAAERPILKIKLGGEGGDLAPHPDGAGGRPRCDGSLPTPTRAGRRRPWSADLAALRRRRGFALIEQPLPADRDGLPSRHGAPRFRYGADESVHDRRPGPRTASSGLYDAVNIKLDKTGGLTEALALADRGRGATVSPS